MLLSIKKNIKYFLVNIEIINSPNSEKTMHWHFFKPQESTPLSLKQTPYTMLVNQEQCKYMWHTKNKILSTSDSMKNKLWQLYFSYDTRTFWQLSSLLQISRGLKWINVRWISQILFKLTEDHVCTVTLNSQH